MPEIKAKPPSAAMMKQIEVERLARAVEIETRWREDLDPKDWLFDGRPIRGEVMLARWRNLDWPKSWVDLGPSIAGNLGPYWHVPLKRTVINGELYDDGDTVHRLYPKVLQTKWVLTILHACYQYAAQRKKKARSR